VSYWDPDAGRWVTPSGEVPVYIGSSSRDIKLSGTLLVAGPDWE
jgi:beta-glucosidase